jgi:hypothetical protein
MPHTYFTAVFRHARTDPGIHPEKEFFSEWIAGQARQ